MAAARPVIAMLNGDGADIIREAVCGVVVNAGDSHALANELLKLSRLKSKFLIRWDKMDITISG